MTEAQLKEAAERLAKCLQSPEASQVLAQAAKTTRQWLVTLRKANQAVPLLGVKAHTPRLKEGVTPFRRLEKASAAPKGTTEARTLR